MFPTVFVFCKIDIFLFSSLLYRTLFVDYCVDRSMVDGAANR